MPAINALIETSLYVEDLDASAAFYRDVLGLRPHFADHRLASFFVAERQMLLLFKRGGSAEPQILDGGVIPPIDGRGPTHLGFAVSADEIEDWRDRLRSENVAIEGEVRWARGGQSLYFRDPDGNLLEVLSPGVWPIY